MVDTSRPPLAWTIVKTITVNECMVEVSKSDNHAARYSYRLTWTDGTRRGAWFPDRGIPIAADACEAINQAELWILDERDKLLKEKESSLADKRAKEDAKRKRHANLEARREANRSQTTQAKGGRRG